MWSEILGNNSIRLFGSCQEQWPLNWKKYIKISGQRNFVYRIVLAKVLLPEYYHLPQPAHALASAEAQNDSIVIGEQTTFDVDSTDKEINGVAFAPLFPARILPAHISLIATDQELFVIKAKQAQPSQCH